MTVTQAVDVKVLVVHASAPDSGLVESPMQSGSSASVSEHTVQRTLLDMGLCSRRPDNLPLLSQRHRQLRLQWAWQHRDWAMDEWKRVAWSDES
ncbi:hypothetical protein AVEN_10226-1 [Araneus ventricosus]|uniref:Transposase Tc1-like domain-containing protein n=1 Tax=Araneus ventricosus TaxID=182803 RepID=A0A4Y2Q3H6_ARAVE|nr:hypothetical protein AVEN_10226-1 [Araneus ventricosus]